MYGFLSKEKKRQKDFYTTTFSSRTLVSYPYVKVPNFHPFPENLKYLEKEMDLVRTCYKCKALFQLQTCVTIAYTSLHKPCFLLSEEAETT